MVGACLWGLGVSMRLGVAPGTVSSRFGHGCSAVLRSPLAMCDWSTVDASVLIPLERRAVGRLGEVNVVAHSDAQRWYVWTACPERPDCAHGSCRTCWNAWGGAGTWGRAETHGCANGPRYHFPVMRATEALVFVTFDSGSRLGSRTTGWVEVTAWCSMSRLLFISRLCGRWPLLTTVSWCHHHGVGL